MLVLQLAQVLLYQGVTRRTLYIGPAVTVIAYLVGSGIYGVGGAIVTSAIAVFLIALLDAARAERGGGTDLPPEGADPTLDRTPDTA
jgi:predicted PurR-regulated permease PerM